ncbi:MAG: glutamine synthetase type III [Ruminococcaceae bacterium]|nr:glutamine synthetase type III [Oscillospiraceae bacterium]
MEIKSGYTDLTKIFGMNVFSNRAMKERLPEDVYEALHRTIDEGRPLESSVAEVVAAAMKEWAIERGATHYTHWFQPLTGVTAEKHDSFLSPTTEGGAIMEFSGKELIKGEPDASSFPSGGLRATFEARGYTAWDCTSPAFLKEDSSGVTLCIPTAFCSYTGEALDKKTPLLRSCEAVNVQALRILKLFGKDDVKRVEVSVGPEQEYFLVDRELYEKRMDLKFTGRTLFGQRAPKGQEMDDHYFGTLKERVSAFMHDLDMELWRAGVSAKTKHNEAAPSQHELAPIYSSCNIATDHNQLTMETMKKIANRHGFACLLHEKPFEGVNGSGKHNNWSLTTDTGSNLLEPGKTPHENAQFLLFLCAVLKAIDEHAAILRASAASAGNDHRLGGHEAPPAIISVFLGDQLTEILENIEQDNPSEKKHYGRLNVGVSTLPGLRRDTTDRNRTSPFAFTGNKFEFRTVGSNASIAGPNTIINTIVAESLCEIADRLEQAPDFESALHDIIKELVTKHKRVVFNGNGYSEEWVEEAARRGLPNIPNSVDAFEEFISDEVIRVFGKHHVYSEIELRSRYEIKLEKYIKVRHIEALTMCDMAHKDILPAAVKFSTDLSEQIIKAKQTGLNLNCTVTEELLGAVMDAIDGFGKTLHLLEESVTKAEAMAGDLAVQARFYRDVTLDLMNRLRDYGDKLESMVDRKLWPIPTYSDMLFYV